MRTVFLMLLLISLSIPAVAEEGSVEDVWSPLKFLVGTWEGTGDSKWGVSTVEMKFDFILDGAFLRGKNHSVYEPQEKNPEGDIHDNWDIFSYDATAKTFVLRQFHAERIFNEFVMDSISADRKYMEFVTRQIENFMPRWRAKQCYQVLGQDEFVETFHLAGPEKDFQLYVTNHFKKK